MNQVDDHWMRPRTKAGTEEMRKRLNAMRGLLKSAATQSIESQIASKVFDEYFSFDWEDGSLPEYNANHPLTLSKSSLSFLIDL